MTQLTAQIRKIAEDVYRSLGSGHPEVVYDRAMQIGLRLEGIKYESQKVIELKYRDYYVGEGYPDLLVHIDGKVVVVELKAVATKMGACEEQQVRNYMRILDAKFGLLINFQMPGRKQGKTELEIKEVE
ncbi:MAG TPA: GxxExxY protein [Candidatus Sulfotelmatobacter sp.]|jgi:GxxExxY protein|nr:GxxExxY protein [Candidatus Sulfotelmatobacter sp.]